MRVQYWCQTWDGKPDPIEAEAGASRAGWARTDDWANGRWQDADTRVQVDEKRWIYTFALSGEKEFKDIGQPGVGYRKTLKVRLLAEWSLPKPRQFCVFTGAVYRPLTVRILWDKPAVSSLQVDGENAGWLEVYNGLVRAVRSYGNRGAVVGRDQHWVLPAGVRGGIEAELLMAVDPINKRYNRTIVTVRSQHNPFSFAADEVARGNRILVDDLGALVVRGDDVITTVEGWRQVRKEFPGRTVYDRVSEHEEQTLSRAWNDMPLKRPLWFVHGLPGNRNPIRQDPNGEIAVGRIGKRGHDLPPPDPKDTDRKAWSGKFLTLRFGFPPSDHRAGRELLEGYVPLLRTWWVDGPIYYGCRLVST